MDIVGRLAVAVMGLSRAHDRVLVAIDGPDAAGKSTLADRLAEALHAPTLRASIDGFHQPSEVRYRRGDLSAAGYYHDSFDYPALLDECLVPFRDGAARVHTARYDYRAEASRSVATTRVPAQAVLVFDGVFLLREQLRRLWTLAVYLHVSPQETLRRARLRDSELFGSPEEVERRYLQRYLPGQELYRLAADPMSAADVVVDNERVAAPVVRRWTVRADAARRDER